MTVLIIDWTGVGGTAEATRSWYAQGLAAGRHCTVLTTLGGVLAGSDVIGLERGRSLTGYTHQVDLVQLAVEYIRRSSPKVVLVQGYVMPHEEQRVADAAHEVGSRLVQVVYLPRPFFFSKSSSIGLRKLLRSADILVAHADHVADRLKPRSGQRLVRCPFPPFEMSTGMLGSPPEEPPVPEPRDSQLVVDLDGVHRSELSGLVDAFRADGRWQLELAEPPSKSVALALQRDWLSTVGESRAALVPSASPWGNITTAVALGLGVVPVVRDVGAQAEQIAHGAAGILVPEGAHGAEWVAACEPLTDDQTVERLIAAGFELTEQQSAAFAAAAREVLG